MVDCLEQPSDGISQSGLGNESLVRHRGHDKGRGNGDSRTSEFSEVGALATYEVEITRIDFRQRACDAFSHSFLPLPTVVY